jgi:large subunit ribosomal protein L35
MPKTKTKRAAAKRYKVTGSGNIRRAKAFKRHLLSSKSRKRKRGLRENALVDKTNIKEVKLILPYHGI